MSSGEDPNSLATFRAYVRTHLHMYILFLQYLLSLRTPQISFPALVVSDGTDVLEKVLIVQLIKNS